MSICVCRVPCAVCRVSCVVCCVQRRHRPWKHRLRTFLGSVRVRAGAPVPVELACAVGGCVRGQRPGDAVVRRGCTHLAPCGLVAFARRPPLPAPPRRGGAAWEVASSRICIRLHLRSHLSLRTRRCNRICNLRSAWAVGFGSLRWRGWRLIRVWASGRMGSCRAVPKRSCHVWMPVSTLLLAVALVSCFAGQPLFVWGVSFQPRLAERPFDLYCTREYRFVSVNGPPAFP